MTAIQHRVSRPIDTFSPILPGNSATHLVPIARARIINANVQPAELVERVLNEILPVLLARNIHLDEIHAPRVVGGDALPTHRVYVGDDYSTAFLGEELGDAFAEAAAAARHDGDFPGEAAAEDFRLCDHLCHDLGHAREGFVVEGVFSEEREAGR